MHTSYCTCGNSVILALIFPLLYQTPCVKHSQCFSRCVWKSVICYSCLISCPLTEPAPCLSQCISVVWEICILETGELDREEDGSTSYLWDCNCLRAQNDAGKGVRLLQCVEIKGVMYRPSTEAALQPVCPGAVVRVTAQWMDLLHLGLGITICPFVKPLTQGRHEKKAFLSWHFPHFPILL